MSEVVDLQNFRTGKTRVFTGRDRGVIVRKDIDLDSKDENSDYEIIVPKDIMSINESFFLGLFGESVRKLGVSTFKEKFKFTCEEHIKKDIEDGISKAIRNKSALG